MIKSFFSNTVHAVITIVSFILIIAVVLFSHTPGQVDLKADDVSPEDIYAPRSVIDTTTTEASRDAARKSVANVYKANDDKRLSAVDNLNDLFATATTLRENKDETVISLTAQLQAKAKIDISEKTAFSIIGASESQFSQMRTLSTIVDNVMLEGVSDVNAANNECKKQINTLQLTDSQKEALSTVSSLVITENLEFDKEETERRREAAASAVPDIEYKKSQIIVRKGEIVSEAQYNMLISLGLIKGSSALPFTYTLGICLLLLFCFIVLLCYFPRNKKKRPAATPVASLVGLLIVLLTFYGSKFVPEDMVSLLPTGFFPGIVAIFATPQTAVISNLVLSIICAIAFDASWGYSVCLILAGTMCAYAFSTVKRRSHLLPASIASAFFYGISFCIMSLIESSGALIALGAFAKGFFGGFLSGLITVGSLPLFEWLFNATTPMKLSELANPENKLLKKLLIEAPGTYHHSLTVANISEIAARSIGADSLLARVGAYYHDIGKLRRPLYFRENQYDKNAHDALPPEKSSELIINHVINGVEIAEKNRLPKSIVDIIAQHHGTTTTGYFLLRAKELDPDVDESLFTYPGPVPRSKEAAIVMLADSCEAAVRSIEEKNEEKIEKMVRKIATERVNSGQFSECNMTFAELEKVIREIIKTLGGYFHERIKYE